MLNGIQSLYKGLGKSGCYFLSIINMAENYKKDTFDVVTTVFQAAEKGYITFNYEDYEDTNNFFVKEPAKLLSMLTGEEWSVSWEANDYVIKEKELAVICYKRGLFTHFVMYGFDSLQYSKTVRNGYIDSYRIFRKV